MEHSRILLERHVNISTVETLERIQKIAPQLVEFAKSFVGKDYSYLDFNCAHFIRMVYGKFNIPILVNATIEPIVNFNDSSEVGKMVLLKHRKYQSRHMAIYIGENQVIHNSFYFGKKVVVSNLGDVLKVYCLC